MTIVVIIGAVWSRLTKTDAACGYVACSLTELKCLERPYSFINIKLSSLTLECVHCVT
jgi:hypothetical protein